MDFTFHWIYLSTALFFIVTTLVDIKVINTYSKNSKHPTVNILRTAKNWGLYHLPSISAMVALSRYWWYLCCSIQDFDWRAGEWEVGMRCPVFTQGQNEWANGYIKVWVSFYVSLWSAEVYCRKFYSSHFHSCFSERDESLGKLLQGDLLMQIDTESSNRALRLVPCPCKEGSPHICNMWHKLSGH